MFNYSKISKELSNIYLTLNSQLTDFDSATVREFIEVKEFGLAYETICDIIVEENKQISKDVYVGIVELGKQMKFEQTIWLKLKPFVN